MTRLETLIVREYRRGKSCREISRITGLAKSTVWLALRRLGVSLRRPVRFRGSCVECGKDSGLCERCPFHRKIRAADLNRWRLREQKNIPQERWRIADEA